ncbi:MAG: HAMP domain-containing protein [Acidobacteriota bacterium]
MTLRRKLLLAQLPLGLVLTLLGIVSVVTVDTLGKTSDRILRDNYRSVLSAQRMKEFVERIDTAALFLVAGENERGIAQAETYRTPFEQELRVQEGNITEAGELEATRELRAAWSAYTRAFDELEANPVAAVYFDRLEPRFKAVSAAADAVLALNQDAMVRKSEEARKIARSKMNLMTGVTLLALCAGIFSSFWLTSRLMLPLESLSLAVRRVGEGDHSARAAVEGDDEIAHLAREINEMTTRIETYRRSSLGELLQAQLASQAAIDSIPDPVIIFAVDGGLLCSNQAADIMLDMDISQGSSGGLAPVDQELRAAIERVRDHVLTGKGPYLPKGLDEAVTMPSSEGERYLLPRATPVYSEEKVITGVTVILQDVTRLRRFDDLRRNLSAGFAHQIGVPLGSLRMAIHVCIDGAAGELTPKQLDILYAARDECERMQTIVEEFQDLT